MKNNHVTAKKNRIPGRALVCALVLCLLAFTLGGCQAADLSDVPASSNDTVPTFPVETTVPETTSAAEETTAPSNASATQPAEPDHTPETTAATEHVHTYSSTVTSPTCTADGFTTYTCSCGYSYNSNPTPALGHTWGEWVVDKEPTTTETGSRSRKCTVCGETETEELDILPPATEHIHNYRAEVHQPSCTEAGYTVYTCDCGNSYTADQVDPLGHTWGEWIVDVQPTQTEPGSRHRVCSVCRETETESIAPIPPESSTHTHHFETTVVPATCTESGYTLHKCSECGDSFQTDATKPLGHSWVADAGGSTHTCSVCNKCETIPQSGASSGSGTSQGPATISDSASSSSTEDAVAAP